MYYRGCESCFRSRGPARPHRPPRLRRWQGGRCFRGAGDRRARAGPREATTLCLCGARVTEASINRPLSEEEGLREDSDVGVAQGCERSERADLLRRPVRPRRGRALAKKPCGKAVGGARDTQKKTKCQLRLGDIIIGIFARPYSLCTLCLGQPLGPQQMDCYINFEGAVCIRWDPLRSGLGVS